MSVVCGMRSVRDFIPPPPSRVQWRKQPSRKAVSPFCIEVNDERLKTLQDQLGSPTADELRHEQNRALTRPTTDGSLRVSLESVIPEASNVYRKTQYEKSSTP